MGACQSQNVHQTVENTITELRKKRERERQQLKVASLSATSMDSTEQESLGAPHETRESRPLFFP